MAETLADIAQKAGVSQATISRVINDKPGVSENTRKAVLDIMQSMGLSRGQTQRGETRLIAIVTPDLNNPIFPKYLTSLNTLLAQKHMLPLLCTYTLSGTSETSYVNMLQNQPIAGVVFLAGAYDTKGSDHSIYQSLASRSVPMAFLNEAAYDIDGLYVGTDDATATAMALRHLINLGHTNIGLLMGDRNHYPTITKYDAAMKFFAQQNIKHSSDLTLWTTYGSDSGQLNAHKLIENGTTAILCANDQLAIGAIKAIQNAGLTVPEDISVIGYDDSPSLDYLTPSLTTLRQPVSKICRAIVEGLVSMMDDRSLAKKRDILRFPPELVVRDSTAICTNRR